MNETIDTNNDESNTTESSIGPVVATLAVIGGLVVLSRAPRVIRAGLAGRREYRRLKAESAPKFVTPKSNREYINTTSKEA